MKSAMIIAIHSYRGGTGKSNVTANLAVELARSGYHVGVVDTDLPSPGVHILFNRDEPETTVNRVLHGMGTVAEAALDVTPSEIESSGSIHLLAGSPKPAEIARIVSEGYQIDRLIEIYKEFCSEKKLDFLLVDTHPGINEPTLMTVTASDLLLMLLRPDKQDYQGTAVTVDVARKLGVPRLRFIVNKAISSLDWSSLATTIEHTYGDQVLAVLPQSDEMMSYGGSGLFCLQQPSHPLAISLREIAQAVIQLRATL